MEASGKSNFLLQYTEGKFDYSMMATIGVNFKNKYIENNGIHLKLQIWDTSGHEKFRSIAQAYYRCSDIVIIMYDLYYYYSRYSESMSEYKYWIEISQMYQQLSAIYIVGNKLDIIDEEYKPNEIEEDAAKLGALSFRISAKTGEGIADMMKTIIQRYIENSIAPKASSK